MSTSRPFRIEGSVRTPAASANAVSVAQLDRVLTELSALRSDLAKAVRPCPSGEPECARHAVWQGVETIREAIDSTKYEIATIHAGHTSGTKLDRATFELSAVVGDTEAATEEILSAAEEIDALASRLSRNPENAREVVQEIHDCAVRIFEACNFQDITGQRISKVVGLMQFIEHHVSRMTAIWGGSEEVARIADTISRERTGDEALLNGPSLTTDANVVSQNDIDSLFA